MKHQIRVTQVFKVAREVTMEVEAGTEDEAIDLVENGEVDKPEWDQWKDYWTLENEEVELL